MCYGRMKRLKSQVELKEWLQIFSNREFCFTKLIACQFPWIKCPYKRFNNLASPVFVFVSRAKPVQDLSPVFSHLSLYCNPLLVMESFLLWLMLKERCDIEVNGQIVVWWLNPEARGMTASTKQKGLKTVHIRL